MADREPRLPEILGDLIAERGYARNRQPILDAVDISAASLSQYARGTTTPSYAKLLALADFFDVSLDHLVYGQPFSVVPVARPEILRYVEESVRAVEARAAAHAALVGRIGRVVTDRLNDVAREVAAADTIEGLVDDGELARLESASSKVDVVTIDLDANIVAMADGESSAGRFLDVVAHALTRGCHYRFVVSSMPRTADVSIAALRELLTQRVGAETVRTQCPIRRAVVPTLLGMGLYQVDTAELQSRDPALLAQFASYVDDDGWFGYLIRPQHAANRDAVMNARRRDTARALFDVLWSEGEPVT